MFYKIYKNNLVLIPIWTLGLFVTIVSLGGKIRISLLGDSEFLKSDEQADQIMNNFFKELEIYKKHIPKKGLDVVNVV